MDTTINMGLIVWNEDTDPYDHGDLVNNWAAIDDHDHTPGKGAPLPNAALPEITQENLGVCSVSTIQICAEAVTTEKLAKCSVTTLELCDNAVTQPKVADNAIGTPELIDASVTEAKVADDSIATPKLKDSAVTNAKINNGAINTPKLSGNAVATGNIQDSAVTTQKIGTGAVTTPNLATDAVTRPKISGGAVGPWEQQQVPSGYLDLYTGRNVNSGGEYAIYWDGAWWDTGAEFGQQMWDGTAGLRAPIAGLYLFEASAMMQNTGTGGGMRMKLIHNHNTVASVTPSAIRDVPGQPYRSRMSGSTVLWMNQYDVCWTTVFQDSGTTLYLFPDNRATHQSLTWLGPPPGYNG